MIALLQKVANCLSGCLFNNRIMPVIINVPLQMMAKSLTPKLTSFLDLDAIEHLLYKKNCKLIIKNYILIDLGSAKKGLFVNYA